MKRILLTLLAIVVVLGLFAATGFAGYRFGYAQGAQRADAGQSSDIRPFDERGPNRMPMPRFGDGFDRGFEHGFGSRGFPMRGFGFFPLMFLGWIAILALIAGFVYWLFTRSGWRLTRTVQTVETQMKPDETETKE